MDEQKVVDTRLCISLLPVVVCGYFMIFFQIGFLEKVDSARSREEQQAEFEGSAGIFRIQTVCYVLGARRHRGQHDFSSWLFIVKVISLNSIDFEIYYR